MKHLSWFRIIFDVLTIVALFLFSQIFLALIEPFKAGFYCDDYSVNLPFKNSTVSNAVLSVISLVVPFVFIFGTELVRLIVIRVQRNLNTGRKKIKYNLNLCALGVRSVPEPIGNFCVNYGFSLLGLAVTNSLTNIGKIVIGRLRPNFLSVCRPNVDPYTNLCTKIGTYYVVPGVDFICLNENIADVNGSRKSFPSGHSSLSFYSMIFLALFINKTWNCRHMGFFKHFVQFLLTALAFFTSLSRIQDNKHHSTDVLAGSIIGVIIAILTYTLLDKYHRNKGYKVEYEIVHERFDEDNRINNGGNITNVSDLTSQI